MVRRGPSYNRFNNDVLAFVKAWLTGSYPAYWKDVYAEVQDSGDAFLISIALSAEPSEELLEEMCDAIYEVMDQVGRDFGINRTWTCALNFDGQLLESCVKVV